MSRSTVLLATAVIVVNASLAVAQTHSPLTVSFVRSAPSQVGDAAIAELFQDLLPQLRSLRTSAVDVAHYGHQTNCALLARRTIATINPGKFILCNKEIPGGLVPLYSVVKHGERAPYYSVAFLANSESSISGIRSEEIKRLVLGPDASISSYIAPLHHLHERRYISKPTVEAVEQELGWEVDQVMTSDEVVREVLRSRTTIGSVGLAADTVPRGSKPILRHGLFPQDVLFISSDLAQDSLAVIAWIESVMAAPDRSRLLRAYTSSISGLRRFDSELQRAYASLATMIDQVQRKPSPIPQPQPTGPTQWTLIVFGSVLTLLGVFLFSRRGTEGNNTMKILGQEFTLAGSSLVIVVLGVILILVAVTAL